VLFADESSLRFDQPRDFAKLRILSTGDFAITAKLTR